MIGATYLHMEKLLEITSTQMSLSITGIYAGGLVGAGICAFVYRKINNEIFFASIAIFAGLSTSGTYFIHDFRVFVALLTVQGIAFGALFAGL